MENENHTTPTQEECEGEPPHSHKAPSLTIDYALYQKYLDNSDMSDVHKCEFLDALWLIIVSFVDLGFGVHPLQQVEEAHGANNGKAHEATNGKAAECGQLDIRAEIIPNHSSDMIEYNHQSDKPARRGSKK